MEACGATAVFILLRFSTLFYESWAAHGVPIGYFGP